MTVLVFNHACNEQLAIRPNHSKLFKDIGIRLAESPRWMQELGYHANPITHAYITKPEIDALIQPPFSPKTLSPNVTLPNTMLPNVTVPNTMLPNVTVPNANVDLEVPNAIILPLLHAKWNTSDSNMRFKHSKQLNAATARTQMATLLQIPISIAESAPLGKTKLA